MSKLMFYLIGQPGAGKTTLMSLMTARLSSLEVAKPVPHTRYKGGVQLGVFRGVYSGTDALSMSIQPQVIEWLQSENAPEVVIAEGDRLSNVRFFEAAREAGYELTVALLSVPDEIAEQRRLKRATSQTQQHAAWVKGRRTKITHLAQEFVNPAWVLNGVLPPAALAARLAEHEAFKALEGVKA